MNRTGFTLMETALALTLLTVGMLGLAGVFSQIVKSNTIVKQKQTATFLAAAKLTELCSTPLPEIHRSKGIFDEPFGAYSWQVWFGYPSDNENIADIWLDVKHKSGTCVKLWTQMDINNAW